MKVIDIRTNPATFISRESFEDALYRMLEDTMGNDESGRRVAHDTVRAVSPQVFPFDGTHCLAPASRLLDWFDEDAGELGLFDVEQFIDELESASDWNIMHAW